MKTATGSIVVGIFTDIHRATQAVEQLCVAEFHNWTRCNAAMFITRDVIGTPFKLSTITIQDLLDALAFTPLSQDECCYYQKELLKKNRIIVVVQPPERVQEARDILLRHGAYDALTHIPCHIPETVMNIHIGFYNPNIPQGTLL